MVYIDDESLKSSIQTNIPGHVAVNAHIALTNQKKYGVNIGINKRVVVKNGKGTAILDGQNNPQLKSLVGTTYNSLPAGNYALNVTLFPVHDLTKATHLEKVIMYKSQPFEIKSQVELQAFLASFNSR